MGANVHVLILYIKLRYGLQKTTANYKTRHR